MIAPSPLSIGHAIKWAALQLEGGESPVLDANVLLCHVLNCQKSYLYTWPERTLTEKQANTYAALIERRSQGWPVAYLTGTQPFWKLDLACNQYTLIPRPETECIIEASLTLPLPDNAKVCDLGTGTGAIALALALERSGWELTGIDKIKEAVTLAEQNARANNIKGIRWIQSNWFSALNPDESFDLIVSNPPYVEAVSPYLTEGDVRFEPRSALVSGDDGLDDIRLIVKQARAFVNPTGWLLIEHGYSQQHAVQQLMQQSGFSNCYGVKDLNNNDRLTIGQYNAQ